MKDNTVRETEGKQMNIKKVVFGFLGFIVLCVVYYCLVPKYDFYYIGAYGARGGLVGLKLNRITGGIETITPSDLKESKGFQEQMERIDKR